MRRFRRQGSRAACFPHAGLGRALASESGDSGLLYYRHCGGMKGRNPPYLCFPRSCVPFSRDPELSIPAHFLRVPAGQSVQCRSVSVQSLKSLKGAAGRAFLYRSKVNQRLASYTESSEAVKASCGFSDHPNATHLHFCSSKAEPHLPRPEA